MHVHDVLLLLAGDFQRDIRKGESRVKAKGIKTPEFQFRK